MSIVAYILVAIVALLHVGFLVLEMFLWREPLGRKVFGLDQEFADKSAGMAKNQGLYNGFLVAGLVWGLLAGDPVGFQAKVFFLICVIIAGVFGAATVSRRILVVQALPAVLALIAVVLSSG
jgi:putative membrane protein